MQVQTAIARHYLRALGAAASVAAPVLGLDFRVKFEDMPLYLDLLVRFGWPDQFAPMNDCNPYFGPVNNAANLVRAIQQDGQLNPVTLALTLRPSRKGTLTERVRVECGRNPLIDPLRRAATIYAADPSYLPDAECIPRAVGVAPFCIGEYADLEAVTMGAVQAIVTHYRPDAVVGSAWLAYTLVMIGVRGVGPSDSLLEGFANVAKDVFSATENPYLRQWVKTVGYRKVESAVKRLTTALKAATDPCDAVKGGAAIEACAVGYAAMQWALSRDAYPFPKGYPPQLYAPDSRGYGVLAWLAASPLPIGWVPILVAGALCGAGCGEVPDTMLAGGLDCGVRLGKTG